MSVEANPPNPSGVAPSTVSMVAVYRYLIRMKRKLEDKQRLPQVELEVTQSDSSQRSEGGEDVSS